MDGSQPRERQSREALVAHTRTTILDAAERLFAERGVMNVSNRQISEAAGQGNNAAVNYHFGTKSDLVRAIVRRHQEDIDARRAEAVRATADSGDVRYWVECLIRPTAEHLAAQGRTSYYARFSAQVIVEPGLAAIMAEEALDAAALHTILDRLESCLPDMPAEVREQRGQMSRQLIVSGYAERERALAVGRARMAWDRYATLLTDAVTGLWCASWTALD